MPVIRWVIPFKITVLPHSIQLPKLFRYPTDLSVNVNKMITDSNSVRMPHPQVKRCWCDTSRAVPDVWVSAAISCPGPATERHFTSS